MLGLIYDFCRHENFFLRFGIFQNEYGILLQINVNLNTIKNSERRNVVTALRSVQEPTIVNFNWFLDQSCVLMKITRKQIRLHNLINLEELMHAELLYLKFSLQYVYICAISMTLLIFFLFQFKTIGILKYIFTFWNQIICFLSGMINPNFRCVSVVQFHYSFKTSTSGVTELGFTLKWLGVEKLPVWIEFCYKFGKFSKKQCLRWIEIYPKIHWYRTFLNI